MGLNQSIAKVSWDSRLPLEIALQIDPLEEILTRYDIPAEEWEVLKHHKSFQREVLKHRKDLQDNGLTFKAKARVQAEAYLEEVHQIVMDKLDTPASVRLDAIKNVVRWGELEPKDDKNSQGGNNAFQININLG